MVDGGRALVRIKDPMGLRLLIDPLYREDRSMTASVCPRIRTPIRVLRVYGKHCPDMDQGTILLVLETDYQISVLLQLSWTRFAVLL